MPITAWRSCSTKHRHGTRQSAMTEIRKAGRRNRMDGVKPYRCGFCGGWHIGHPPASGR